MIWEIDTDDFRGLCYGTPFVLTKAVIKAMNAPASLPPQCVTPTPPPPPPTTTPTTTTTTTVLIFLLRNN